MFTRICDSSVFIVVNMGQPRYLWYCAVHGACWVRQLGSFLPRAEVDMFKAS